MYLSLRLEFASKMHLQNNKWLFLPFYASGSVLNISVSNGKEGADTASCKLQAAHLQLLSRVTNFFVPC